MCFDGRQLRAGTTMVKELAKATAGLATTRSTRRVVTMLRLMHHNNEFNPRMYAAARYVKSAMNNSLPDPLENAFMVIGNDPSALELRDRKFLDVPGSNRGRGWQHLPIKTEEEQFLVRCCVCFLCFFCAV